MSWRPKERIVDRLAAWREASANGPVGTLLASGADKPALEVLAEEVLS